VSRFVRQETPPQFDDCQKYLPFLRRDFRHRCAYCERTEGALGGEEFFEIDHFRPVSRFREHVTHYPNLITLAANATGTKRMPGLRMT